MRRCRSRSRLGKKEGAGAAKKYYGSPALYLRIYAECTFKLNLLKYAGKSS